MTLRRRGGAAGFTLIELLASLALLSVIVVSILGGINLGRRAWETSRIEEDRGEVEAVERALTQLIEKTWPAVALNARKVPAPVFSGRPDGLTFVTLSEGEAQRGGLILTDIGFSPEKPALLGVWTSPFRPADTADAPHGAMHADDLLDGVTAFELSYYGSRDARSPPEWRADWTEAEKLPALVGIKIIFERGGRRRTVTAQVALRQS